MAGAGLRAAARRYLPRRDHGGPRAASSSPSCPGCGPPGPGVHCPGVPRSTPSPAPAGAAEPSAHLWARYQDMRRLVHDLLPPEVCSLLNPAAIYANNEISLQDVEVYGFDYDYTLAQYADTLHPEIFNAARDILIEHYKYPEGIRKYDYNPSFAIRGLHYDIQKSLLMKIDAFHYVQLGTAYRGLQPVPDEEVIDLYGGTQHIPLYQMSGFYGKVLTPSADAQSSQLSDPAVGAASLEGGAHILVGSPDPQTACLHSCPKTDSEPLVSRADGGAGGVAESVVPPQGPSIKQFMDIFSLPEMALLSCVVDHFLGHGLEFDQAHLYKDVTDAIRDVHVKGLMYQWIEQDMEKYILRGEETFAVLNRLVAHGKQLFLITNSPFSFVDKGMRHMVGPDWRQLFDVVIVQADKPSFFTDRRKPFRKLDEKGSLHWDRITRLEKGKIYRQGNLFDFLRLTEWRGPRVLYFGDHLYSDLADLMLRHGWRTGAIIPELEREIRIINTEQYMHSLTWQQALTGLLERMQTYQDAESRQVLAAWMKERQELRCITKALFNAQFGSIFRTFHNPTYFSRRLVRFSDLYMASLSCLLNYRVDFTFYPRRTPLQHEAPLWMDQLCTGCMKTPFLGDMAHIR
uniref:5'-nucleotidase domain containing 2 n=1 Tax=Sus scrofa TaxID=9823 RepID=A0A8D1YDB7_PIG